MNGAKGEDGQGGVAGRRVIGPCFIPEIFENTNTDKETHTDTYTFAGPPIITATPTTDRKEEVEEEEKVEGELPQIASKEDNDGGGGGEVLIKISEKKYMTNGQKQLESDLEYQEYLAKKKILKEQSEIFGPAMPTPEQVIKSFLEDEEKKNSSKDPEQAKKAWEKARQEGSEVDEEPTSQYERDAWMVQPTGPSSLNYDLMQRHVTHFSRRGASDTVIDPEWIENPEQKRLRMNGLTPKTNLQQAKDMAMQRIMREKAQATKEIVEQYNEQFRSKSLLELHNSKKPPAVATSNSNSNSTAVDTKTKDSSPSSSSSSSSSDEDSEESEKKKKKKKKRTKKSSKKRKRKEKESKKEKKKSKKKNSEEDVVPAKEPYWDRDRDLARTRVDPKKRTELIAQSAYLNSRFSTSKFL